MTIEVKRPTRLDIVDMPRDPTNSLGALRSTIVSVFNRNRQYPVKMKLFIAVLKYAYNRAVEFEKKREEFEEAQAKNALELDGREIGIELDRRKSLKDMQKDYDAYAAKDQEERAKVRIEQAKAKEAEELKLAELELAKRVQEAKEFVEANSVKTK